jgi:hypothetical protein
LAAWRLDHLELANVQVGFSAMTEIMQLIADCELYAKVIEGVAVVADDWQPGDPERREPRETLLRAAAALRDIGVAQTIVPSLKDLAQICCEWDQPKDTCACRDLPADSEFRCSSVIGVARAFLAAVTPLSSTHRGPTDAPDASTPARRPPD